MWVIVSSVVWHIHSQSVYDPATPILPQRKGQKKNNKQQIIPICMRVITPISVVIGIMVIMQDRSGSMSIMPLLIPIPISAPIKCFCSTVLLLPGWCYPLFPAFGPGAGFNNIWCYDYPATWQDITIIQAVLVGLKLTFQIRRFGHENINGKGDFLWLDLEISMKKFMICPI